MSDTEPEETPQIPVDAPAAEEPPPPAAEERVELAAPSEPDPEPAIEPAPEPAVAAPVVADDFAEPSQDGFAIQHPEALIAGAFAGAFVFAKILQRITSR